MRKIQYILISLIALPISGKSQSSHYFGVNINFSSYYSAPGQRGALEIGAGLEYGVIRNNFFIGIEGGFYGAIFYNPIEEPPFIYNPYDYYPVLEEYLGIHGGFIVNDWLWVGIGVLASTTELDHISFTFDSTNKTWNTNETIKHPIFFNIGPDLRISVSPKVTINTAFTVRRGLKLGAAYVF